MGDSLVTYLQHEYDQLPGHSFPSCRFRLMSTQELESINDADVVLSFFLYRVMMNEHLRSSTRTNQSNLRSVPLSVDLHYLMIVWAPNALIEQQIFAWAMRQLYLHPVFDASTLIGANWASDEIVHVVPAELSHEELVRIWDVLEPKYHLSKAYIAKAVRIDPDEPTSEVLPMVSSRFVVGNAAAVREVK
ncbi:DUF4255 domain-containing protein [Leptolyngbya sp. AN02str]|uniref:DUF4255 domain-containing protein n=1 Tax=Leptolyngbya sp. AN02str TaxID=3423363 RepID=UPI003D31D1A2